MTILICEQFGNGSHCPTRRHGSGLLRQLVSLFALSIDCCAWTNNSEVKVLSWTKTTHSQACGTKQTLGSQAIHGMGSVPQQSTPLVPFHICRVHGSAKAAVVFSHRRSCSRLLRGADRAGAWPLSAICPRHTALLCLLGFSFVLIPLHLVSSLRNQKRCYCNKINGFNKSSLCALALNPSGIPNANCTVP